MPQNTELSAGCVLVPQKETNSDLWFLFHHNEEGSLGVNLTKPHPALPYEIFKRVLKSPDLKDRSDQIVLEGGPVQNDSALTILHETKLHHPEAHKINKTFSFLSHSFILKPTGQDMRAQPHISMGDITFSKPSHFLVIAGYRIWHAGEIAQEINDSIWLLCPATESLIFKHPCTKRQNKAKTLLQTH